MASLEIIEWVVQAAARQVHSGKIPNEQAFSAEDAIIAYLHGKDVDMRGVAEMSIMDIFAVVKDACKYKPYMHLN